MWGRNQIHTGNSLASTLVRNTVSSGIIQETNYFSLFVSYNFTSYKTCLKELHESKSDMPLFQWVFALK